MGKISNNNIENNIPAKNWEEKAVRFNHFLDEYYSQIQYYIASLGEINIDMLHETIVRLHRELKFKEFDLPYNGKILAYMYRAYKITILRIKAKEIKTVLHIDNMGKIDVNTNIDDLIYFRNETDKHFDEKQNSIRVLVKKYIRTSRLSSESIYVFEERFYRNTPYSIICRNSKLTERVASQKYKNTLHRVRKYIRKELANSTNL